MSKSTHVVVAPCAGLYNKPDDSWDIGEANLLESEVLHGELVEVITKNGDWAKVVTKIDNYPGFVRWKHLAHVATLHEPTHLVSVPQAAVYGSPNFKSTLSCEEDVTLSMNARVHAYITAETPEGIMLCIEGMGWIFESDLRPIGTYAPDFVAVATEFVGTRYWWGGRSRLIDCSALLQAACIAAGISCPRNVGQQVGVLGEPIPFALDLSNLRRGDLVFWTQGKGRHVAIMLDSSDAVHATVAEPYRKTLVQPLVAIAADQARDGNGPVTMVRRFPDYRFI